MAEAQKWEYDGETRTAAGWGRIAGISAATMRERIRRHGIACAIGSEPKPRRARQLSPEDVELVQACIRERMRLQREIEQLSDAALAEKFETSALVIERMRYQIDSD